MGLRPPEAGGTLLGGRGHFWKKYFFGIFLAFLATPSPRPARACPGLIWPVRGLIWPGIELEKIARTTEWLFWVQGPYLWPMGCPEE